MTPLHLFLALSFAFMSSVTAADQEKSDKAYFLQQRTRNSGVKLLIVTLSPENGNGVGDCEVVSDRRQIREILSSAPEDAVQEVSESEMNDTIDECNEIKSEKTQTGSPMQGPSKPTTEGYDGWNVIFPGTKWCGAGDIAKNYDDLGLYADTDKCCRAHDNCNDTLGPGQSRNSLKNTSPFTALSCKCDDDFYECLEKVDTMISNKIGNLYFNLLKRKCYKYDYPLTKKCKTYRSFLRITCKEYAKNTKAPKVYQWREAKLYRKLPLPGPFSVELPF